MLYITWKLELVSNILWDIVGNWQGDRLTHVMLIIPLLSIQFHWNPFIWFLNEWYYFVEIRYFIKTIWKILQFQLITGCVNSVERPIFCIASDDSSEAMQKVCLFTTFCRKEIKWKYDIFCDEKINEDDKSTIFFDEKQQQQKCQESICESIKQHFYCEFAPLTHNVTAQNFRDMNKI